MFWTVKVTWVFHAVCISVLFLIA